MNGDKTTIVRASCDFEPKTGPKLLVEHAGGPTICYEVSYSICPSPTCRCAAVDLVCLPEAGLSEGGGELRLRFDTWERAIDPANGRPGGETALEKAVAKSFTSDQWFHLHQTLFVLKQSQMEHMDLDRVDAAFPPEFFVEPWMIGYAEVFPYADSPVFNLGDQRWLAEDQYCVELDCSCEEVLFCFFQMPDENNAGEDRSSEVAAAVRYNLRTRAWKAEKQPIADAELVRALTDGLEESRAGLFDEVKERRRQLRYLFAKAVREHVDAAPQPVVTDPKIGRNQPCPCGSGKKYKRCCGR